MSILVLSRGVSTVNTRQFLIHDITVQILYLMAKTPQADFGGQLWKIGIFKNGNSVFSVACRGRVFFYFLSTYRRFIFYLFAKTRQLNFYFRYPYFRQKPFWGPVRVSCLQTTENSDRSLNVGLMCFEYQTCTHGSLVTFTLLILSLQISREMRHFLAKRNEQHTHAPMCMLSNSKDSSIYTQTEGFRTCELWRTHHRSCGLTEKPHSHWQFIATARA